MGSVEPLKKLYARWRDKVNFVDIIVRQAHPGRQIPAYYSFDQKMRDAQRYQDEEGIPWCVVVDDIEGTTHNLYGGLADPSYLLDADGRVSFYHVWTHAPALHKAIDALLNQAGRGVVKNGTDRLPHPLASITDGWKGLRRGLPQSFIELEMAAPGAASSIWLGYQIRPLMAALTLRSEPLRLAVKIALAFSAATLFVFSARRLARRRTD